MMPTLWSFVAPQVVFKTTCGATNDDKIVMTPSLFTLAAHKIFVTTTHGATSWDHDNLVFSAKEGCFYRLLRNWMWLDMILCSDACTICAGCMTPTSSINIDYWLQSPIVMYHVTSLIQIWMTSFHWLPPDIWYKAFQRRYHILGKIGANLLFFPKHLI